MSILDENNTSAADRIVRAALALIEERGLAAVTISEVAKRAGVARQTVYNHFDDVDAIVLAILGRRDTMDSSHVDALLDTAETPTEKLELYVRHAIAAREIMGDAAALRQSLSPEARRQIDSHRDATAGTLAEIIAAGVGDGSFRQDLDPELNASLITGLLSGVGDRPRGSAAATSGQVIAAVLGLLGASARTANRRRK